jgi:transcriptional regulator with XRE-family HTH domain
MDYKLEDVYGYPSLQNAPGNVAEALKQRLRLRRKEWHYSQEELAKRSGVSLGSLKRFESTNEIELTSLLKLAFALDCVQDFNALFANPHYESLDQVFYDQKHHR